MVEETKELVGAAPSRRLGSRCQVPCLFYRREGAAPTKPYTANLLNLMAVARTTVKRTVPAVFTASETFDVGVDLGSPVSLAYFDR
ncbi:MAG: hypothetical protein ACOYMG_25370, partial [Candidatus Methylumidiphilus sp.]